MDIWVMQDEKGTWVKKLKLGPLPGFVWHLGFWNNGKFLFVNDASFPQFYNFSSQVVLYDPSNQEIRELGPEGTGCHFYAGVYYESLVSLFRYINACEFHVILGAATSTSALVYLVLSDGTTPPRTRASSIPVTVVWLMAKPFCRSGPPQGCCTEEEVAAVAETDAGNGGRPAGRRSSPVAGWTVQCTSIGGGREQSKRGVGNSP
ncbi:hypothetical protein RHMOL_Rhmol08G0258700 [Rhododendron molle]|uniref:Uncharacterized protein n=1 Tax=Rhododendron molle TaxID=49168 RepID=A0ACC0MTT7_RHOML|nr:hypothetical protein RHMOL_Rhmol08G0258700 [Rhododendron molle]